MRHTWFLNYALYQVGWFSCVLGAAAQHPWMGFHLAVTLMGLHLTLSLERFLEVRLIVLATAVRLVIETAQIAAGTYRFPSGTVNDAFPSPWLVAMWAQFGDTASAAGSGPESRPPHRVTSTARHLAMANQGRGRSSAVVMVTALGTPELEQGALDLGACKVLQKPFEIPHLQSLLESACSSRAAH